MSQNLRFRLPGEVDCFQKPVSGLGVTLHQWEGIMGGDLLPLVPQIWRGRHQAQRCVQDIGVKNGGFNLW